MKHLGTKTLESSRLILRKFSLDDANAMFANWANNPEVTKFLTWPVHRSVDMTTKVLTDWVSRYEAENYYQWAIVLKETNEPIGSIGAVAQNEQIAMVHIGYCIGTSWWNQGITSEALSCLLEFFFMEVGVHRVEAKFDTRNPNSGKVMKKCGMIYEGKFKHAVYNEGWSDLSLYGLVYEDYLSIQATKQSGHELYGNVIGHEPNSHCTSKDNYTNVNSSVIDAWVSDGWQWGIPISHEAFVAAQNGQWDMLLTPTKFVPKHWFGSLHGTNVFGLAAGGGQQMPIFAANGAICTVLDYSAKQIQSEIDVAIKEGYSITAMQGDMTKPLPFADESFDLIFHPVSNCYVEDVLPIWHECYRVLKPGGILLSGLCNEINYVFDDEETHLVHRLPFNPLKDKTLYDVSIASDWGIQFSHTIEEQIGGQLQAGFVLTDVYQDTNGEGKLHEFGIASFWATRAVKPSRAKE